MTNNLSEELAVAGAIDPQLVDNAAVTSDWVAMKNGDRVMFVVSVGATDITVDAKVQQATDASGTGAADMTGKAITQIAADEDNGQVIIEVKAEELTSTNTHVAVVVTVGDGTTGAYVSAIALQGRMRYKDAANYDVASVAEIVAPS